MGDWNVWELVWHPGEKQDYFVADQLLVDRKAKLGQLLVKGMPYHRGALDQEMLDRIVSWGYPGSAVPVQSDVQLLNPEWWAANYPGHIAGAWTPEAIMGLFVAGGGALAPLVADLLPNAPPVASVQVAAVGSYP